jgi:hypothetical protein
VDSTNSPDPWRAWSGWLPLLMSGTALALLAGHLASGPHEPYTVIENGVARPDEGAAARLFQLLMVLQLPAIGWFALRWLPREPKRATIVLACQELAIVAAMAAVVVAEA